MVHLSVKFDNANRVRTYEEVCNILKALPEIYPIYTQRLQNIVTFQCNGNEKEFLKKIRRPQTSNFYNKIGTTGHYKTQ